jgi:hypothetical protein
MLAALCFLSSQALSMSWHSISHRLKWCQDRPALSFTTFNARRRWAATSNLLFAGKENSDFDALGTKTGETLWNFYLSDAKSHLPHR